MKPISTSRTIAAGPEKVFRVISDIRNFSKAVPEITQVEFVTAQHEGAGTRFRETRRMNNREHTVEMELTEYVENDRVRIVSDAGGTVWDTLFTVAPQGAGTELTMTMDARAYKLLARIMNPLVRGMIAKAIESDMDAVKAYCEADES